MTDVHQPEFNIQEATQEVAALLGAVREDQLTHPTPCERYSVAALLDHLMGLCTAFTGAARKTPPPVDGGPSGPGQPTADHLDPAWRDALPSRLQDLAKAWQEPSAWEGMTEAGGMRMPAELAAIVTLDELVLHGWDLARATGQSFVCAPANSAAVLGFTEQFTEPGPVAAREGLFGPAVVVPDDAPAFDRALGFAGRDPGWSSPVG